MCKFPSFFSNHFLSPQVLTWKEVGEIDILSNCAGKRYYRINNNRHLFPIGLGAGKSKIKVL